MDILEDSTQQVTIHADTATPTVVGVQVDQL